MSVTRRVIITAVALSSFPGVVAAQHLPPDTCRQGFVWREAFPGDLVCVAPSVRDRTEEDNSVARDREESAGSYGPATCRPGFVWREAFPGDVVCVAPAARDQAAADNREAEGRRQPPSGRPTDPLHACRDPYVWRLARPGDFVCVTPETHAQVVADNRQAATRQGSDRCKSGFVWREAGSQDFVCVTPETREQARGDNAWAYQRSVRSCEAYADTAALQYQRARSLPRCVGGTSASWHDDTQTHYNWCITVDPGKSITEERMREGALAGCSQSGGSGGGWNPPPQPRPPKCCFIPIPTPQGGFAVSYQCGPQCP